MNDKGISVKKFNDDLLRYIDTVYGDDLKITRIKDVMKYSIESGGKRIRPLLLIEFCKAYGGTYDQALPFAIAIEMIHTYSLIHDDLPSMDDDDLRRGMPTCHKKYGEAMAILAGDALLTLAHEIMLEACSLNLERNSGQNGIKAALTICTAAGISGMINGQVLDTVNEELKESIDIDTLNYINSKKTGALFTAACVAGAFLGDDDVQDTEIIKTSINKMGIAFQIKDDILDITGKKEVLGKNTGSDFKKSKLTYPHLFGIEESEKTADKLKNEAVELLSTLKRNTSGIIDILNAMIDRSY